ncbi:MAG TPA: lycopene cyclase family protein [Chitinophagaceae bacterium]|nr:lycopene cyclase family protein [Chitinophagaceae bacterium]
MQFFSLNSSYRYDYIIAGAGCAGLSLAIHLINSGKFADKKILLIDKDSKKKNDRTWCFWETKQGLFEPLVYRKWQQAWFYGKNISRLLQLLPYEYKLIRGSDFYKYCFDIIGAQKNFEFISGEIEKINENGSVVLNGQKFESDYIFNSIIFEKPALKPTQYYLLQHFKGWIIETAVPVFDANQPVLMDFRVGQERGTTFVYVMPFSETQALIEYTLFNDHLLEQQQYDSGLKDYTNHFLKIDSYKIIEEEFGVIPMTNYRFPVRNGKIINIGTAGGQTKASSGYTFRFIQKHSAALVKQLIDSGNPFLNKPVSASRFHFYDSTLLHILSHHQLPGEKIFSDLFKKNNPQQVLRFLDNESSLKDELRIISSLPTIPFFKAALKQL